MQQEGDVLLYQTTDDGNINVEGGLVELSGGLQTAAYLSLFGGNENDDGIAGNPETWWGNTLENESAHRYISETQHLIKSLPITSANLLRVEDAAKRDLAWFKDRGVATEIRVSASILGLNMIKLTIDIDQERLEFTENWRSAS
jgi:phage gp46-like protein